MVFARRGIVDQRRWMTMEEFNATFALRHFRPGPDTVKPRRGVRIAFQGAWRAASPRLPVCSRKHT
jgi:chromate transport protein ChrA